MPEPLQLAAPESDAWRGSDVVTFVTIWRVKNGVLEELVLSLPKREFEEKYGKHPA